MARSSLRQLLAELKRRRVYRVAAVYVVVTWVLLQLGNIVVEPLHLPGWTGTMLILLLVLGLPVAVVLAWAFDITPEGVRRTAPLAGPEGLAAAQTALGTALATTGRLAEGQSALERAAELNPNDWVAVANLGSYHGQLGLWEQTTAYVTRALEVDPEHPLAFFLQGVFGPDRDSPERLRMRAEQLADRAETDARVGAYAAELFALLGDAEATARVLEPVYRRSPPAMNNALVGTLYAWALRETGRGDEATAVLRETEAVARERIDLGDESPAFHFTLVIVHSLRGELDEAFRWLEEAAALGWNRSTLLELTRGLEPLRADPRFQEVYDRIDARRIEIRDRVLREGL